MNSWVKQVFSSIESKILLSVAVIILFFSATVFGIVEFTAQKITQIEQGLFEDHALHIIENVYLVSLTEDADRIAQELKTSLQANRQISSIYVTIAGKAYNERTHATEDFRVETTVEGLDFVLTGINFLARPLELIQYFSIGLGGLALLALLLFHKMLRRFIHRPIEQLASTLDFYASEAFKANPVAQTLQKSGTELDILIEKTDKIYRANLGAIADEIALRETVEKAVGIKNLFIASMVHDFRTPLVIMQRLLNDISEQIPPTLLAPLLHQFDDMELMVSNALDLSRIESGQPVILRNKTVRLFELVNDVVASFQAEANAKGLYIYINLVGGGKRHLVIDDAKYKQVLRNLVSNAVKYTNEGFVEVLVVCENRQLITQVTDTGRGISAEQIHSIFTPFLRVTNDQIQGTGVGLSFCKLMLNSLGFDLELNPTQQGSQFQYAFPVVEWVEYAPHNLEINQVKQRQQVMVVSSDSLVQGYLHAFFISQGFKVGSSLDCLHSHDLLVLHELLEVKMVGTGFNPQFPMSSAQLSKVLQQAKERRIKVVLTNNALKPSPNVLKMFGHSHAYILSELKQLAVGRHGLVAETAVLSAEAITPPLSEALLNKSLLIADDTAAYQALLVEQLKSMGFKKLYTANNGQEALRLCLEQHIQMVFMDHMMPIMDGLESAAAIKHRRPETLVIGFSAVLTAQDEIAESPMDKVFTKDFKNFAAVFAFAEQYFKELDDD